MASRVRFDPHVMALRGKIGGHVTHARHDSAEITAPARAAFNLTFERQADPAGSLSAPERARRAYQLRRAHFARLAYLSAMARASRVLPRDAEREAPDPDAVADCFEPPLKPVDAAEPAARQRVTRIPPEAKP